MATKRTVTLDVVGGASPDVTEYQPTQDKNEDYIEEEKNERWKKNDD